MEDQVKTVTHTYKYKSNEIKLPRNQNKAKRAKIVNGSNNLFTEISENF